MRTVARSLADLRNVHFPLQDGQRSTEDVLVRITYRDGRPSVVEYASPGRALYMLERYSRERYINDSSTYAMVERVQPKAVT